MPSCKRPWSSARSNCFVLVTSRIAFRMSPELTIALPSMCERKAISDQLAADLPVKGEARLLDVTEWYALLVALLRSYDDDFVALAPFDAHDLRLDAAAERGAEHVRA